MKWLATKFGLSDLFRISPEGVANSTQCVFSEKLVNVKLLVIGSLYEKGNIDGAFSF